MPFSPPKLAIGSALVGTGLGNDRFHVTDYMGDGGYPGYRAEKDEAEHCVAAVVDAIGQDDAPNLAVELRHYLRAMFPPDERQAGEADPCLFARQVGSRRCSALSTGPRMRWRSARLRRRRRRTGCS